MVVDGAVVKMIPPDGFLPPRPIAVPILVAANGPKGFAVAHELGDGVMTHLRELPRVRVVRAARARHGARPGRVAGLRAGASRPPVPRSPSCTTACTRATRSSVETLPGGVRVARRARARSRRTRGTSRPTRITSSRVTERDRPLLSGEGLTSFTWTGEADVLRARLDATAAAGTTEILYAPIGPDIPRELRAFMAMARA